MKTSKINLTKPQLESINYDSGDLLVKGVAGSGKSIVLLQRAVKMNKNAIKDNVRKKILILTYTNSLVQYTSEIINQAPLSSSMIDVSTIDKECTNLYKKLLQNTYVRFVKSAEKKEIIEKALQEHLSKSITKPTHRFYSMDTQFWIDEFQWIKEKDLKNAKSYIESDRLGRGGKIRMSKEDKSIAFEMFEIYKDKLKSKHMIDWEDCYSFIIKNADKLTESDKYDYVLIDEAQDLSFVKIKFAKLITRDSITIAADKAQKIYNTSFTWKDLGIDIKGRGSKTLDKSFRSTKEIILLAESLLEANRNVYGDNEEYTTTVIPEITGKLPSIIQCKHATEEKIYMNKLLKNYIATDDIIGILYRTNSEFYKIKRWLEDSKIPYEQISSKASWSLQTSGVKLCTFHSSKGLEFDTIIMPFFNNDTFPLPAILKDADKEQITELLAKERSLIYVGMTRARSDLYITYSGNPSLFLDEMDSTLYDHIIL